MEANPLGVDLSVGLILSLSKDEAAASQRKGGDWTATRSETRYGCFLPDLTGLARAPPAASLRSGLSRVRRWRARDATQRQLFGRKDG